MGGLGSVLVFILAVRLSVGTGQNLKVCVLQCCFARLTLTLGPQDSDQCSATWELR